MSTKNHVVFDGATVPKMQAVQQPGTGTAILGATLPTMQMMPSGIEQKGATVPGMQPVPAAPAQQSAPANGTGTSTGK